MIKLKSAMNILGFTGSRWPLPPVQEEAIDLFVRWYEPTKARHGDCINADEVFHNTCVRHSVEAIIVHPPDDDKLRAFCNGDIVLPVAPYLDRNRNIVILSDVLLAAPDSDEHTRSGTWSTVRAARKRGLKIVIALPDGRLVMDRGL